MPKPGKKIVERVKELREKIGAMTPEELEFYRSAYHKLLLDEIMQRIEEEKQENGLAPFAPKNSE